MTLLAHVTTFDLPTMAAALAAGVAIGIGLARGFSAGRGR